ncbi:hypothetical protein ACG2LH_13265 [Zhouia sp. PK063]|uniref:hypothetical protein n=1 Tax=Zhouia sp. PK063 TaxID=3373602 RepID=UPI0037941CA3
MKQLLTLLTICLSISAWAQIDNSSKQVIINNTGSKVIDNSSKTTTGGIFTNTPNNNSVNFLNNNSKLVEPGKTINFSGKDQLHDASELYANKFKGTKDNRIKPEYMNHQYLGDFKTGGKTVQIICRDFEYVDGDRVSITVNGVVVQPNVLLEGTYKSYFISLNDGFNTIDFTALNQGTSGPNTADFKVFDEKGKLMAQNQWNLLTGVKATLIVVKEQQP